VTGRRTIYSTFAARYTLMMTEAALRRLLGMTASDRSKDLLHAATCDPDQDAPKRLHSDMILVFSGRKK